ncbi:MAG: ArnT family glycosyltransferase [Candidatus Acetothermia bacterium]
MRNREENSNSDDQGRRRVRIYAAIVIVTGIFLCVAAGVFSPGFVQEHLLTNRFLDEVTLKALFRSRLTAVIVGLVFVGVGGLFLYHPERLLAKIHSLGRQKRNIAQHLPSLDRHYGKIAVLITLFFCGIVFLFIFTGEINEDEGWYLYASKLVYEGSIPFRDFSYTQPPLLPYVYGGLGQITGIGLLVGRIITAGFGLLTLVFTMATAKRLAGNIASLLAGAAIALNPFAIYFMIITKTYSLSTMLMVLSIFLLFRKGNEGVFYPLSVICLGLAIGVRITILPMLFFVLLYVAIVNRKYLLRSVVTSGLTLSVIFLPFLILDPKATFFNVLGYHLARYSPQTFAQVILGKIRTIFELSVKFPFLLSFIALGIVFYIVPENRRFDFSLEEPTKGHWPHLLVFSSFAVIFLVHFLPGGALPEYHVLNIPLAAIFAGWLFQDWSSHMKRHYVKTLLIIVVIGLLLFSFIGSRTIHRLIDPRTSYINLSGGRLPLREASQVASFISENTSPDDPVFTTHTYLAIEANRDVLDGMEMGIFSFYPNWTTPRARRYKVVNLFLLRQYIENQAGKLLILTDRDFTLSGIYEQTGTEVRRTLLQPLESNYEQVFKMENFGQFGQYGDTLYVYQRRSG